MKTFCQFCKTEGHWGSECPRLKSTSHGAPRVETKQLGAYETTRVQRRPLVWGPKPTTPTELTERSLTSAIQATKPILEKLKARIAELEAEVKYLKHELTKRVDATAPVVSTGVAPTQECPVCKTRRETRAKAQQKWRLKSNARSVKLS